MMEENRERTSEREIDLRSILNLLKRHIVPLFLVTALFASGFYVYSRFFISKKYEASATLIVNNMSKSKNIVNYAEVTAAQSLADANNEEYQAKLKHDYDIVIGAMADDQIYNYITDLISGNITRAAFWELAKFRHPTHQIALCTPKALECIKYIGAEEL